MFEELEEFENADSVAFAPHLGSRSVDIEGRVRVFISGSYQVVNRPDVILFLAILRRISGGSINLSTERFPIESGGDLLEVISTSVRMSDYVLLFVENGAIPTFSEAEIGIAAADEFSSGRSKIIPIIVDGRPPLSHFLRGRTCYDISVGAEGAAYLIAQFILKDHASLDTFNFDISRVSSIPTLIEVSSRIDKRFIQITKRMPSLLFSLSPRQFEEFVAELFSEFGYTVELTAQTRDGGRDVIAIGHDVVKSKFLIECKRFAPDRRVSVSAVRALYGVKHHEGATKAILATTAGFSRDAILFFEDHRWELEPRDYNGIVSWLQRFKDVKAT